MIVFSSKSRKQKRIEILNMLLVNDSTLISKQWVAKPPHKFCKQKISDSLESRIILTNVSMLPLKCLMPFSLWCDLERVTRSCWKKQRKTKQQGNRTKLVEIHNMICRAYGYYLFLQLLGATHQGFPISKANHLTQVSNITL